MNIELRRIHTEAEREPWNRAIMRSFFAPEAFDERVQLNNRFANEGCRDTVAEIDGVIAGTFRSFDTMMTMPEGPDISVDAITCVTVQGTHRRRGVLTAMMRADLRDAVDRGQPAAILFSAEYPIYARYGFGVATRSQSVTINKHRTKLARVQSEVAARGSIRYVEPQELRDAAPRVFEATRRMRAGEIGRSEFKWDLETGVATWPGDKWKGWQVISANEHGVIDGYARWHVDELWDRGMFTSTLHVDAVHATSDAASERLWHFLFSLDLIATIKIRELPIDDPLQWRLSDARAMVTEHEADSLWLRTLDPVALLTSRALNAGVVDVAIIDDDGFGAGVFRVEAGSVKRMRRRTADITMNVSTFSMLVLGTVRADVLRRAGLIDENKQGTATQLSKILAVNAAPMASTHF